MGWFKKDSLQIIVFQSYGTKNHFYVRGRALEDERINLEKRNVFSLLRNSYKRFESDEIKNTELTIKLPNNFEIKTKTDNKGYFLVDTKIEQLDTLTTSEGWLPFKISYTNPVQNIPINNNNEFHGEILIPSETAEFGVASDIDDTILHTGVISKLKWKLLINSLFKSPLNRKAIEGSSDFYSLLHTGKSGENANPIFYVSHSPWNLYLYLELFLKQNDFPKGPILLRSFSNMLKKKTPNEKPQKQKEILNLLKTYPDLPFILIGDSGEHDVDIYLEIAELFPDRIKAIYLRSVKHEKRIIRVKGLLENYKTTPALLVESSDQAIEHAKVNGFIK